MDVHPPIQIWKLIGDPSKNLGGQCCEIAPELRYHDHQRDVKHGGFLHPMLVFIAWTGIDVWIARQRVSAAAWRKPEVFWEAPANQLSRSVVNAIPVSSDPKIVLQCSLLIFIGLAIKRRWRGPGPLSADHAHVTVWTHILLIICHSTHFPELSKGNI